MLEEYKLDLYLPVSFFTELTYTLWRINYG